jgi:hypothetical protein
MYMYIYNLSLSELILIKLPLFGTSRYEFPVSICGDWGEAYSQAATQGAAAATSEGTAGSAQSAAEAAARTTQGAAETGEVKRFIDIKWINR